MSASDWITLDVGGKKMSTTRSTLTSCPDSVLAWLFNPDYGLQPAWMVDVGRHGVYKLDSNPKYFEVILDWLRHRKVILPKNLDPDGMVVATEYYGLPQYLSSANALVGIQKRNICISISINTTHTSHPVTYIYGLKAFDKREPTVCRNILNVLAKKENRTRVLSVEQEHVSVFLKLSDVPDVFVKIGGFRVGMSWVPDDTQPNTKEVKYMVHPF